MKRFGLALLILLAFLTSVGLEYLFLEIVGDLGLAVQLWISLFVLCWVLAGNILAKRGREENNGE